MGSGCDVPGVLEFRPKIARSWLRAEALVTFNFDLAVRERIRTQPVIANLCRDEEAVRRGPAADRRTAAAA